MLVVFALACQPKQAAVETKSKDSVAAVTPPLPTLRVDTVPTMTAVKLAMTIQYCKENYGVASYKLDTPKIIVVHYTAIPSLKATLDLFKRDNIASSRNYIKDFSQLNVGIHYVIDTAGAIYNTLPDSLVARHLIGFNHVSIGIENIAADSAGLTDRQLTSNVQLIRYLVARHPSVRYMIGHHEYNDVTLPHYTLFRSLNPAYKPYGKIDPGPYFMNKLRQQLASNGIHLEK